MFAWLKPYLEQFKGLWDKLTNRARVIIGIGVVAVLIFFIYMITFTNNPHFQVLFSDLGSQDASAIVQKLDDSNIQYQLADNNKTILVPSDVVYKTRLQMAGDGLPSQGVVGFEIFDQSSFGTTDFERKVNFYRALGGELSRSIQDMSAVDFARVQITAPKESIFADEDQPAAASVLLKLVPGYRLNNPQVQAIANLVASSVQGMEADQVTIVDTDGNLLTSSLDKDSSMMDSQTALNQFDIEREFADGLRQDLKTLLTKVLGPDNYTLQVKAKLNFDHREVQSTEYSPVIGDKGIERSVEEQHESYQGTGSNNGGVPGTTTNVPQYQTQDANTAGSQQEKSNVVTNYEINQKIEKHEYAPGEVERISVAVVVNNNVDQQSLDKIKNIVQAAIGYDSGRGDTVAVTNLAFDKSLDQEIAQAKAAAAKASQTRTYLYAGLIIAVFILLFILFMVMRRSAGPVSEEITPGRAMDFMVDEDLDDEVAASSELTEEEKIRRKLRENIAKTVSDKPEEVAQLLKSWLIDD